MSEVIPRKAPNYAENRAWSDLFIEPIRQILRQNSHTILSVAVSSQQEDVEAATDFVIRVEAGTVGARVRRGHISFRDLTIGSWQRDRQGRTELDKILDGEPRWYLYCWTKQEQIREWMFVDMAALASDPIVNLRERRKRFVYDGIKAFVTVSIQELVEAGALLRYEKTL